jgi:hypothetical protein
MTRPPRRAAGVPGATRLLLAILGLAFVVSVVHYVDNYVNYADYPQPARDGLPAPSARVIAVSWFVFTASGLLGAWWWLNGRRVPAAVALAGYSVSGLIGVGHYLVTGATAMPWWRQTHVIVDIACGAAVLAFACWAVLTRHPAGRST